MFASKDTLLTRPSGYTIARSVRLRSSASAYFNRTPASAGNRKTWTWSGWIKRGTLGASQTIFGGGTSSTLDLFFWSDDTIHLDLGGTGYITTTAVFRDPSAWYHVVLAFDTTQATSTNRVKLYINGVQQTLTFTTWTPTQNTDYPINLAELHTIGRYAQTASYYLDGYLTEINFIDGQALTPSSFGETDSITGVWKPKAYSGTYGTNGFELNFSDNSSNTATTIGKDYSGNGNNWTPNNISVTSGVTYDSMVDSPTVSAVSSNYCVMNPLFAAGGGTFSNGNLQIATGTSTAGRAIATMGVSSGKWYWEITPTSIPANVVSIGFVPNPTTNESGTVGNNASEYGYLSDGQKFSGGSAGAYGASYVANDVIGVALDLDAGTIVFYKNGTSQGTAYSSIPLTNTYIPAVSDSSSSNSATFVANFGQRPFTYTPPTGFVALNTYNLPASTITNGAAYMAATTYTGDSASPKSFSNAVNGVSFQPDFVWIKNRSNAYYHNLYDSVRGSGSSKDLNSNTTNSEATNASDAALYGYLSAFNSNGFQTTNGTDGAGPSIWVNQSSQTYVAWQWKAGGSSSSNTNGSITSTVSAGATQGFSVVTYTANNTAGATIGHGLGVAPSFIIVKCRNNANSWNCYHRSLGNTQGIDLNSTGAASSSSLYWNNTSPTSTVFSVSTYTNNSTFNYVAYCFAAVAGYSAFGSYTGNGSADGPFVFTNFRPRWILLKRTDSAADWFIGDTSRNTANSVNNLLQPSSANAESTYGAGAGEWYDLLSNGFKIRSTITSFNASGGTYIYACFAENPLKYALAR